jgi:hypothetical protein
LFFGHANLIFPNSFRNVEAYLLLGLSILYIFKVKDDMLPRLRSRIRENQKLLLLFFCFIITSFASIFIIFPRAHYLLLPGVLIIIGTAILIVGNEDKQEVIDYKKLLLLGLILVAATPHVSYYLGTRANRPVLETITFIKALQIEKEVNILEAEGGYNIYLGDNFQRVAEYEKDKSCSSFLKDRKINMVVVTGTLKGDSRFREDEECRYFLVNYMELGYIQFDIPKTDRKLLVDKQLLPSEY